jgi:hypothetical protein
VGQLDTFAIAGVDDGVVTDDITAAEGVDADFVIGASPDITEAPVTGYNDASILGSVSRGLKTEAYAQTRLYFWPWFMPPVSVSA